jgi:hypothetical protein
MNVVRRHDVVEHRKIEALLGLEELAQVTASVTRKLPVAAVHEVPDVTGQKMTAGAGHRLSFRV